MKNITLSFNWQRMMLLNVNICGGSGVVCVCVCVCVRACVRACVCMSVCVSSQRPIAMFK